MKNFNEFRFVIRVITILAAMIVVNSVFRIVPMETSYTPFAFLWFVLLFVVTVIE
jgi:hypothetical protein